ncbi:MAG: tetraacyldisaccharide 4'-kinase [Nitrosomonas communis]|nr:tetraacyldisaccharide 4'-kinase [Nitrosomonas communis]
MNWSELYWHRVTPFHVLLWPLSLLFIMVLAFKRLLFRLGILRSVRLPVPIIFVDSITVGDAGKTSLVIWLINALKAFGLRPGIISRGYSENYGSPIPVTISSKLKVVGNRALLIAYQSKDICPIWIGHDRVKVAQALLAAHPECNVLICEDGLQDVRLQRDLEIVVVDNSKQNFGNGLILPAGPLRDSLSRLNKVTAVVMNQKSSRSLVNTGSHVKTFYMRPGNVYFTNLLNPDYRSTISVFRDKSIHVITDSQDFLDQLKYLKINVRSHSAINHYQFTKEDLQFPDAEIILMKAEDAVKCLSFANKKFWVLHEEIVVDIGLRETILKKLREQFMDPKLLDILVCPLCKGPLTYKKNEKELICKADRLAFPIRDGIPVMLEEEARILPAEEEI